VKSPIEDTIWASSYGSVAAVQAAFDRLGPEYHEAIVASGVPADAAEALMPHLDPDARGIDFGCGSGVLGMMLRGLGLRQPLDGLDISPVMLELAQKTGCYRELRRCNLLAPEERPMLAGPYDFAVTVGVIGDYVPYYMALPQIVAVLRPGAHLGFTVDIKSTPWPALERLGPELGLSILSERTLVVPEGKLMEQTYHFFVARLGDRD
jgi:predicted TPR repeat methyltransferase